MQDGDMQVSLYSDPDYRLWVLLERARGALLGSRSLELSKYGVSAVEAFALFVISDIGGNATPAEISRRSSRKHNTIMALLARMEKRGLVTLVRDEAKKNNWRVNLTEEGERACTSAMRLDSIHGAMALVSEEQKQALEPVLKSIFERAVLQQTGAPFLAGDKWDLNGN